MTTYKIALFSVRGQPPHLGHVLTIMRIYPLYTKIIVGISENTYGGSKKQVIHPKRVRKIFKDVFQHLPKIEVISLGKGISSMLLSGKQSMLPKFDVIVSGNVDFLREMEKLGFKTRFVERSKGLAGWSGTELREALNWE